MFNLGYNSGSTKSTSSANSIGENWSTSDQLAAGFDTSSSFQNAGGFDTSSSLSGSSGYNTATSSQVGGGISGSTATRTGGSSGSSSSQDTLAFQNYYNQLYGDASGVAGGMAQNPFLSTTANQLFASGSGILGGLQNDVGSQYLQSVLGSNGNVDEQIGLLGQDINKFLSEGALPEVRRSASLAGQLGGSRQGVAESNAVDIATNSFARGAADIRNQNLQRQLGAAGQLSGQNLQAAQIGLAGNESLYGLANQGFMSSLSPYAALASIYGDKATLGSSISSSSSFDNAISNAFGQDFSIGSSNSYGQDSSFGISNSYGENFSVGGANSYGENFSIGSSDSYGYDISQATSKSKGKSTGVSLGFGK